ncbi:hypothetical protein [Hyphomonas sp.]|uniref:hypothetical protein n=1 Tax=Hyphomonas sp. TaxID=87 RepID=UPI003F70C3CB
MNKHILGDRLFLTLIRLFGTPFFSESVQTASFDEHLRATQLELPDLDQPGFIPVPVSGLADNMQAGLKWIRRSEASAPTILFHQGGGELPFDRTIGGAFPSNVHSNINVIAIKTPFQSDLKELKERFVHFNNYVAMIASVVQLTEALVQAQRDAGSRVILVAGYSLGGFVSCRHHLHYNSADAYVPFVAGTSHAEIFFTTVKAARSARKHPDIIRSRLNFGDAWKNTDNSNVYPVLAKYDQLNRLSVQGPSYGNLPYELWEGGHLHGARHPEQIREKLLSVIARHSPISM